MAAPRGPYTPKSGPLAGRTFYGTTSAPTAGYQEYQTARAQALYGFKSYGAEKSALATSHNEAMYRVTRATMQAHGASIQQVNRAYLQMRQADGGKHPTRKTVREKLVANGTINPNEEPDWGAVS